MLNPETDVLASRLDRVLSEHVAKGVIGASLALIRPGGEVLTLAAGCADRATGRRSPRIICSRPPAPGRPGPRSPCSHW